MKERANAAELIHREIDGEITPEESAELRRRVAEDSGLLTERERLGALSRSLAAVGLEEPPPGFVADVMRALRLRASERPRWIETWRAVFSRRPVLAPALSLAAGILVGALVVGLLGASRIMTRDDDAAGTILPASRRDSLRPVDRQELVADGIRGEVTTRRGGGELLAELHVESRTPLQIDWEFDQAALAPVAFERGTPTAGQVTLEPGHVRISQAGSGQYRLVLSLNDPSPATLRLSLTGGGIALERRLAAGNE
jgi:hypothetical protein